MTNNPTALDQYRADRDLLLANIVQACANDDRFVAAWLAGSLARNAADALSDLDLTLVVADEHSDRLCQRLEQVSAQTTPDRLDLFCQFGMPAIIHENNLNAPEGGTLTSVFYAKFAIMVDWTLLPQSRASRTPQSLMLFEKSTIPVLPPPEPESLAERIKKASEVTAFFWMMMAVTAKYLVRHDQVFVTRWCEELTRLLQEVERLAIGQAWEYHRGSLSKFEPTIAGQKQAIEQLGVRMQSIMPDLAKLGGHVLISPMPEIKKLLDLADEK